MTIGQVAALAGIQPATVRYYEQRRLLERAPRTRSGYRSYTAATVNRLRFIKHAQSIGFTLDEIQELLTLSADDAGACPRVEATARERIRVIDERLHELHQLRDRLTSVVHVCEQRRARCPVLETLGSQSGAAVN